jgi:hypothetical protein
VEEGVPMGVESGTPQSLTGSAVHRIVQSQQHSPAGGEGGNCRIVGMVAVGKAIKPV